MIRLEHQNKVLTLQLQEAENEKTHILEANLDIANEKVNRLQTDNRWVHIVRLRSKWLAMLDMNLAARTHRKDCNRKIKFVFLFIFYHFVLISPLDNWTRRFWSCEANLKTWKPPRVRKHRRRKLKRKPWKRKLTNTCEWFFDWDRSVGYKMFYW